eukprot:31126-Pelagococcus_subviridis.AAC.19
MPRRTRSNTGRPFTSSMGTTSGPSARSAASYAAASSATAPPWTHAWTFSGGMGTSEEDAGDVHRSVERKRKRTRRPRLARELEALPVRDALVHEEDVHLLPVDALRVFQPRERLRDGAARDGEREVSARVDGSLRVLLHLHHERDGERLLVVERLDDELAAADALDVLRAEFEVLVLLVVVVVRGGGGADGVARRPSRAARAEIRRHDARGERNRARSRARSRRAGRGDARVGRDARIRADADVRGRGEGGVHGGGDDDRAAVPALWRRRRRAKFVLSGR